MDFNFYSPLAGGVRKNCNLHKSFQRWFPLALYREIALDVLPACSFKAGCFLNFPDLTFPQSWLFTTFIHSFSFMYQSNHVTQSFFLHLYDIRHM